MRAEENTPGDYSAAEIAEDMAESARNTQFMVERFNKQTREVQAQEIRGYFEMRLGLSKALANKIAKRILRGKERITIKL